MSKGEVLRFLLAKVSFLAKVLILLPYFDILTQVGECYSDFLFLSGKIL